MPAFGIEGGVSVVIGPKEVAASFAQIDRDRTTAPEELEAIEELSESTKVYIYSVGAWHQQVSMGSLGVKYIPGLAEERVLVPGDLSVSDPLVVKGVPSEPYPGESEGRRIYHKPQKNDHNRKHTGYHLALEIIGAADKSNKSNDLRPWGLFVSKQPQQFHGESDPKAFALWRADVLQAQKSLATQYAQMCGKATAAWKAGKFQIEFMNDEKIFVVARILKKTKIDCPWLENTLASAENVECIAKCGRVLPVGSLGCGCGARQVTDLVYEREMKRRQEENSEAFEGSQAKARPARGKVS